METLTVEEVITAHYALVEHFKDSSNPIDPAGPRNEHLLRSAVSRQDTSLGGTLKYAEARANAATLLYGICMNHPFHNGNKRTAFVCALIHLERNGYIPEEVSHDQFYNMLLALCDHRLVSSSRTPKGGRNLNPEIVSNGRLTPDSEVHVVSDWLRRRTRREDRREHPLAFRQLRKILNRFNFFFENPKSNFIDLCHEETTKKARFLRRPETIVRKSKIMQISYVNEGAVVQINTIKDIRKRCQLTSEHGIDSRAFYDNEATLDSILNEYRFLLTRLAKT